MSSVTSLETLPRELLWMIIDYAPEKVYDIRLVGSEAFLLINRSRFSELI